MLRRLVVDADVLIENFRPGTLDRLGFPADELHAINPRLVITRITGFGQTGPYAARPGFASIAESMSGLAALAGEPDGPPLLPPIALTDEITGLAAAFATMVALRSGVGQEVDVSLLESVFQFMGPLIGLYRADRRAAAAARLRPAVHGAARRRTAAPTGSGSASRRRARPSPRGCWTLLGVAGDDRFATFAARSANRDALEALMRSWCARHTRDEVIAAFEAAQAAIGPVLSMADISADPHYAAREAIVDVDGVPMQGLIAKLSATPGELRWPGRHLDADGDADPRARLDRSSLGAVRSSA